jgi:hypothetical protein
VKQLRIAMYQLMQGKHANLLRSPSLPAASLLVQHLDIHHLHLHGLNHVKTAQPPANLMSVQPFNPFFVANRSLLLVFNMGWTTPTKLWETARLLKKVT